MDFSIFFNQLRYLVPESTLLAVAIIAICVHLFVKNSSRLTGLICLAGLVAVIPLVIAGPATSTPLYSATLSIDPFAAYFKIIFLLAGSLCIVLCLVFFNKEDRHPGEVYYLVVFAVIGMMFTAAASDLITFYVAFELFAIISYILAGIFKKDQRSAEAGLKYFILGVLSSGIMVMGMAFIYGLTGHTILNAIAKQIIIADQKLVFLALALLLVGFFFKLALVPFHLWAPDVYEGAPLPITIFISTAPKAAVFAVFIRFIAHFPDTFNAPWQLLLQAIAILSMFWGNIAALRQSNIKRMMAYSSIAHAGYIMIGLCAWGRPGTAAILFYLFVYVFMNTAAFALVLTASKPNGFGEDLDDLNGLARRAPLIAGAVIVLLLSLVGIPPTGGFFGKYFLLSAAIEKGLYWLAIAAALNSVISLFYYFRIVKAMFMVEPTEGGLSDKIPLPVTVIIVGCCAVLLFLGVLPHFLSSFIPVVISH